MMTTTRHISPSGERIGRYLNPLTIFPHLGRHAPLIWRMARREVLARYRGSFIGLGWSLIQPLMMLCVYTFVFSVVFQSRWGTGGDQSQSAFALTLFISIITYNIFSELINMAPGIILNNVSYVKRVVFPLEILPVVTLVSVLINTLFSLLAWLCGMMVLGNGIPWTALLIPVVWLPLVLFSLGCAYFLSSLGVFIRDIGATVSIITTVFLFMSPIFYPLSSIPEQFHFLCRFNPFALFVEDARRVALWGRLPDWTAYGVGLAVSLIVFTLGYAWFVKSKRAFADVM